MSKLGRIDLKRIVIGSEPEYATPMSTMGTNDSHVQEPPLGPMRFHPTQFDTRPRPVAMRVRSLKVLNKHFVIGRDPRMADTPTLTVADDPGVCERHAAVSQLRTQWYAFDLSSSHGTFVNDLDLGVGGRAPLEEFDTLQVGQTMFITGMTPINIHNLAWLTSMEANNAWCNESDGNTLGIHRALNAWIDVHGHIHEFSNSYDERFSHVAAGGFFKAAFNISIATGLLDYIHYWEPEKCSEEARANLAQLIGARVRVGKNEHSRLIEELMSG